MSREIDERVVKLEFDNARFEKNAKDSISTLEKLKKALDLKGSAKSLKELDKASKEVDLKRMADNVDMVADRFSNLGIVGMRVLERITDKAIDVGSRVAKAITLDPLIDGFKEYELEIGAVQTIMAGTGRSVEDVYKQLDILNEYADKTIYSFSDMTQNIGKFTNAGVELEDAVSAIQGVANVAAVSGANAQQASHAMYNFAQALSSGYVKLIDWKSIENAQMATVEFKQELINTAEELGTLVKQGDQWVSTTTDMKGAVSDAFDSVKGFNDSLSHQWMTTDVLTETLKRYTDETTEVGYKAMAAATEVKTFTQLIDTLKEAMGTGWGVTWRYIIGNFEEAKEVWTGVSNALGGVIDYMHETRNSALETWRELGGREDLLEALKLILGGIGEALQHVASAFRTVFPPMTGERLAQLTKAFRAFAEQIYPTEETLENLRRVTYAASSVLRVFVTVIKDVLYVAGLLVKPLLTIADGILDMVAPFADAIVEIEYFFAQAHAVIVYFIKDLNILSGASDLVSDAIYYITHTIGGLLDIVGDVLKGLTGIAIDGLSPIELFATALYGIGSVVNGALNGIAIPVLELFGDTILTVIDCVRGLIQNSKVLSFIGMVFQDIGDTIYAMTNGVSGPLDYFNELVDELRINIGGLTDAIIGGLYDAFDKLSTSSFGEGIFGWYETFKDHVKDALESFLVFIGAIEEGGDLFKDFSFAGVIDKFLGAFEALNNAIVSFTENIKQNGLKKAFGDVLAWLGGKIMQLAGFIKGILESIDVSGVSIGNVFKAIFDVINGLLDTMGITIDSFNILGAVANVLLAPFALLGNTIGDIAKIVAPTLDNLIGVQTVEAAAFDEVDRASEGAKKGLEVLADAFNPAKIAAVAFVGIISLLSFSVFNLVNSIAYTTRQVGKVVKRFAKIEDEVADTLKAFRTRIKDSFEDKIYKFAKAIAILAGSLWLLAQVPLPSLAKALGALTASVTLMMFGMYKMNQLMTPRQAKAMAAAIKDMSLALVIIGAAIRLVATGDPARTAVAALALSGTIAVMTIALGKLADAIGKNVITESAMKATADSLVKISAAMVVLGFAVKQFGNMEPDVLIKGLGIVISLLIGFAFYASKLKSVVFELEAVATAMIAISGAVVIMSFAVKRFARMKPDTIIKGLLAVLATMGVMWAAAKWLKPFEKDMKGFAGTMAGLALAMDALAVAVMLFGKMKPETLEKGLGTVAALMVAFVGISKQVKGSPDLLGTAAMFMSISLGITALVAAVYLLGTIDLSTLTKGVAAVGALALIISTATTIAKLGTGSVDWKGVLAVTGGILLLSLDLALLSQMDWDQIKRGLVAMVGVMAVLLTSTFVLSKISFQGEGILKQFGANGAAMIGITAVMIAIGYSLSKLAKYDWKNLLAAGTAMTETLIAVGGLLLVINKFPADPKAALAALPAIIECLGITYILGEIIANVAKLHLENFIETATGISELLLAFAVFFKIAIGIGPMAEGAAGAVLTMIGTIGIILGVLALIGTLNDALKELFGYGIEDAFESLGRIIGSFFGGIAAGFQEAKAANIEEVGTHLGNFAKNAEPFFALFKGEGPVDPKNLESITQLGDALSKFASAGLRVTGKEDINPIASAAKGIGDVAKELPAIIAVAKTLGEGDKDKVLAIVDIVKAFAEAAQSIPNEGGALADWVGDNRLATFAVQLTSLVEPIRQLAGMFQNSGSPAVGITEDQVKSISTIADAVTALGEASTHIEGYNGIQKLISDPDKIKNFAEQIGKLADPIQQLGGILKADKNSKGLTTGQVQGINKIADAIISLAEAAKKINDTNTDPSLIEKAASMFGGKAANGPISKFCQAFIDSKDKIREFIESTKGMKGIDNAEAIASTMKAIGEIAKNSEINTDIVSLGTSFEEFGKSYKKFANNILKVNGSQYNEAFNTIQRRINGFKMLGESFREVDLSKFDTFIKNIKALSKTGVEEAANNALEVVKASVKAVSDYIDSGAFQTIGETICKRIGLGISGSKEKINTAMDGAAREASTAISNIDWEAKGRSIAEGIARGISNNTSLVTSAISKVNKVASDKADKDLEINSPSHVYQRKGSSIDEGEALGIEKNTDMVVDAQSEKYKKLEKQAEESAERQAEIQIDADKKVFKAYKAEGKGTSSTNPANNGGLVDTVKNKVQSGKKKAVNYLLDTTGVSGALEEANKVKKGTDANNDWYQNWRKGYEKDAKKTANKIKKDGKKNAKGLQDAYNNKDLTNGVAKNTANSVSSGVSSGLTKGTKSGVSKAEKTTKKELTKALKAYAQIMDKFNVGKYDPFNSKSLTKISKNLKTGTKKITQITGDYFLKSIKDKNLRGALTLIGESYVKEINKAAVKEAKKTGKNVTNTWIKQQTKAAINELNNAYSIYQKYIAKLPKKTQKEMLSDRQGLSTFLENYKSSSEANKKIVSSAKKLYGDSLSIVSDKLNPEIKVYKEAIKKLEQNEKKWQKVLDDKKSTKKQKANAEKKIKLIKEAKKTANNELGKLQNLSNLSTAAGVLDTFGQQLFMKSDEYKEIKSNLKSLYKEQEKQQKSAEKLYKKVKKGGKDSKQAAKDLAQLGKDAEKTQKSINKAEKQLAKGAQKYLKQYRNELKETFKEYSKFTSIQIMDAVTSGFNWESTIQNVDRFGAAMSRTLKMGFDSSMLQQVADAAEAFDVLSNSFDVGLNLLEKFTNTATFETKALLENAQTQVDVYDEFQKGLQKLREMGLDESVINSLEETGISSLNYIRGFASMTADEIAKYNAIVQKKTEYENQKFMENIEKQRAKQTQWQEDINKLQERGLSEGFIKKLKYAGVQEADIIHRMVEMTDDDLKKLQESYEFSIDEMFTNFGLTEAEIAANNMAKGVKTFREALQKSKEKDDDWEAILQKLKDMGYSKDVVDYFRSMGYDAGIEWARTALKESEEGIAEINSLYTQGIGEGVSSFKEALLKEKEDEDEWKQILTQLKEKGYADEVIKKFEETGRDSGMAWAKSCLEETQDGIDTINSMLKEDKFQIGIDNITKENDGLQAYIDNIDIVNKKIEEHRKKGDMALTKVGETYFYGMSSKYEVVAKMITDLGYTEAEAMKYLANATEEQINSMYDQVLRRADLNASLTWDDFYAQQKKKGQDLEEYKKYYTWIAENSTRLTKKQRESLLNEIQEAGVDGGLSMMRAIYQGWENDHSAWYDFQEQYKKNLSISEDTANIVTSSTAAVYTGLVDALNTGLTKEVGKAKSTMTETLTSVIDETAFKEKGKKAAKSAGKGLKSGAKSKVVTKDLKASAVSLKTNFAKDSNNAWKINEKGVAEATMYIGKAGGLGVAKGMTSKDVLKAIDKSAKTVRTYTYSSFTGEYEINSPSKIMADGIGYFITAGVAEGMIDGIETIDKAEDAVKQQVIDAMSEAVSLINAYLNGDLDFSPIITPVVDLDAVTKDAKQIENILRDTGEVSVPLTADTSTSAAGMTFIQNNYSPKALDQLEIYRMTNNAFARLKGMVTT